MKGKGETTNGPAKTPRRSVRIAANFIVIVLCLLAVEAGFTFYYFLSEGKLVSPQTREEARTNTFVVHMTSKRNVKCRYMDTVYPHPYLTNVHADNPPCDNSEFEINNVGLFGRDFPYKKETDNFRIMLSGGSVASMFVIAHPRFEAAIVRAGNLTWESAADSSFG